MFAINNYNDILSRASICFAFFELYAERPGITEAERKLFMVHVRSCFLKKPYKKAVCSPGYSFGAANL
jgi:hypothetical protein